MYSALARDRLAMSPCRRVAAGLLARDRSVACGERICVRVRDRWAALQPANTCAAETFLQTGVAPGSNGYTIQSYGAITSWYFWTSAEAVPGLALKVARPLGGGAYTIVGESVAGTQHPDEINTFKADILVEPGEVIGIYTSGGSAPDCGSVFAEPFDTYVYAEGNWVPENTTIFQSPAPEGTAPNSLFPVAANISEPPGSSLQVPPCSGVGFAAFIGTDYGTAPKGVHYIIDGETEGFAKANSEGYATVKPATVGMHTIEYWAEDKATDLERDSPPRTRVRRQDRPEGRDDERTEHLLVRRRPKGLDLDQGLEPIRARGRPVRGPCADRNRHARASSRCPRRRSTTAATRRRKPSSTR